MRSGIEFRAKDINTDEWIRGCLVANGADETYIYKPSGFGGFEKHKVNSYTVGEYTGISDTNYKPVFEGDIVSYNKFGQFFYGIIERKYSNWVIQYKHYCEPIVSYTYDHFFEVKGNRWDNPTYLDKVCKDETVIEKENKLLRAFIKEVINKDDSYNAIINNFKLNADYEKLFKSIKEE